MDWAEVMVRRDRLMCGLLPHLGEKQARRRADDIVQAILVGADPAPERVALRMLLRDLGRAEAASLAASIAGPWRSSVSTRPAGVMRPRASALPRRPRRETRMLGLWS